MKKLLLVLLCLPMIGFGQEILVSKKQKFLVKKYDTDWKEQEQLRKIVVYNDSIYIELFNGNKINSKISFDKELTSGEGDVGKMFLVENYKNGLIVIYESKAFLNLDVDGATGTYYFENYIFPSMQDLEKQDKEIEYKTFVKLYGKLTADCIIKKEICIGMSWMGVFEILGEAEKQDMIESSYKTSVILSYNDVTIYCEMKKDGVFVEKIHYHN